MNTEKREVTDPEIVALWHLVEEEMHAALGQGKAVPRSWLFQQVLERLPSEEREHLRDALMEVIGEMFARFEPRGTPEELRKHAQELRRYFEQRKQSS